MKRAGQIVLTPFPYTDLSATKLRPVLMLRQASRFDDWLVCMVSSKGNRFALFSDIPMNVELCHYSVECSSANEPDCSLKTFQACAATTALCNFSCRALFCLSM